MDFELDVAMTVRKPRRDIASVIFNPHYVSAWTDQVLEMRPLADGPLRAGSRLARKTRFLGWRFHDVTEVLDHVPGQFLDMVTQRPLAMRLRYSLEGIPEGTIVRVQAAGHPVGLCRLTSPVLSPLLRRAFIRDLEALKRMMESNAFRTLPVTVLPQA